MLRFSYRNIVSSNCTSHHTAASSIFSSTSTKTRLSVSSSSSFFRHSCSYYYSSAVSSSCIITQFRRVSTVAGAEGPSAGGGGATMGIFGGTLRILGLTAAFALGSISVIIISWPLLDTFLLPVLFRKAIYRGADQYRHLEFEPNSALEDEKKMAELETLRKIVYDGGSDGIERTPNIIVVSGPPSSAKSELVRRITVAARRGGLCIGNKNNNEIMTTTISDESHPPPLYYEPLPCDESGNLELDAEHRGEGNETILSAPTISTVSQETQTAGTSSPGTGTGAVDGVVLGDGGEKPILIPRGRQSGAPRQFFGLDEYEQTVRPVMVLNLRGFVNPATMLHGTLTYVLPATMPLIGSLVHAYIKLVNAGIDILTVNNSNAHVSMIFFAMTLGHIRHALFKLQKSRKQQELRRLKSNKKVVVDAKPVIVLDHVEQFLLNERNLDGVADEELKRMQQMLLGFLLRTAQDEETATLILVVDSDSLQPRFRQQRLETNGNNSSSSNSSYGSSGSSSYFNGRGSSAGSVLPLVDGRHHHNLHQQQQQHQPAIDFSGLGSSVNSPPSLAESDLLRVFPFLANRAVWFHTVPKQNVNTLAHHYSAATTTSTGGNSFFSNISSFGVAGFGSGGGGLLPSCNTSSNSRSTRHLLRRLCTNNNSTSSIGDSNSSSSSPPPILIPFVASEVIKKTKQGASIDSVGVVENLDSSSCSSSSSSLSSSPSPTCECEDESAVQSCLDALEREGLIHRVMGAPLNAEATASKFAEIDVQQQQHSIAYIASNDLVALELAMEREKTQPSNSVDVYVAVKNRACRTSAKKKFATASAAAGGGNSESEASSSSSSSNNNTAEALLQSPPPGTEHLLVSSDVVLRRVSINYNDTLDSQQLLQKLSDSVFLDTSSSSQKQKRSNKHKNHQEDFNNINNNNNNNNSRKKPSRISSQSAEGEETVCFFERGLVNLNTGIVSCSEDEILNEARSWRGGEVIAPSFFSPHDVSAALSEVADPPRHLPASSTIRFAFGLLAGVAGGLGIAFSI